LAYFWVETLNQLVKALNEPVDSELCQPWRWHFGCVTEDGVIGAGHCENTRV